MAIAHQSATLGAVSTTAGNYDTSVTPGATINGVCVVMTQNAATTDLVTSATYGTGAGSVTLARAASPYGFATENTEPGGVYIYWAGDSAVFPTGTQTVRIARTGTTNLRAAIYTMTCAAGQVVTLDSGGTGTSTSAANPSWTHASLVDNVMAYLAIHSGLNAMTNTPATGWTLDPTQATADLDLGTQGRGFARLTSATNTAGSLGAGWTAATADDFVGCSIAFWETNPPAGGPVAQLHRSPRPAEQHTVVGAYAPVNPSVLLPGG